MNPLLSQRDAARLLGLLTITGGDDMHVNRKNAKYWEGKLTARIVLFSNELLRMQDQSGALASRFIVWQMRESFLGRDDFDLYRQAARRTPRHPKSSIGGFGSSTNATTTTGSASMQERSGHVAGPCRSALGRESLCRSVLRHRPATRSPRLGAICTLAALVRATRHPPQLGQQSTLR